MPRIPLRLVSGLIRGVFFDIGGVLLHSKITAHTSQTWERRLGLPEGKILRFLRSGFYLRADSGEWTEDEVWREFALGIGALEHVQEIAQDSWWWDEPDQELMAFAAKLRPRMRLGIISNAWPGARKHASDRFGLADAFEEIVISSEERCMKPDRRIFEIALARLQVQAHEAVFVDDQKPNIEAARELGFHGILHRSTSETIEELQGLLAVR